MTTRLLLTGAFAAALNLLAAAAAHALDESPTADQLAFFEKKIRPVLAEKCYKCHAENSEKIRGGLTLDTREGIRRGGDNGPAVVPGDLKESLLIEAVRHSNKDTAMPPEKEGGKLSAEVIADFETWVKMGAPDPREGAAKVVKKYDARSSEEMVVVSAGAKAGVARECMHGRGRRSTVSSLAGLAEKGLKPVADADNSTLLRRALFRSHRPAADAKRT